jgi:hypothetical protein
MSQLFLTLIVLATFVAGALTGAGAYRLAALARQGRQIEETVAMLHTWGAGHVRVVDSDGAA